MRTVTQYREEIANLTKKLGDIDEKCIRENRDPHEKEIQAKKELMDGIERLREIVETQEAQEKLTSELSAPNKPETKPRPTAGVKVGQDRREQDRFLTFSQQLVAVMKAAGPSGHIDPRLFRGATGLGESIPSDGGLA